MEPALALLCQRAADEGLSVSINCVLTTLNYLQVPRLVEFASERGMPVSVQPCNADSRPDWARLLPRTEDMQQVLQVILTLIRLKEQGALLLNSEKFLRRIVEFWESGCVPPVSGCYYGRANVTVQHTGDVVPCWRLPAVGNLSTDSLVDLWHAKAFQGWRREMEAGHCPGCWLACSFDWHVLWHSEGEMDRFWRKRGELPVDETRERGGGQQHGND
jgi:MoaA/NifB/PqqE/SkfB family radical SAM enzyme